MIFNQSIFDHGAIIPYYPYRITDESGARVRNPKFDRGSGLILDIKENGKKGDAAMATFLPLLLTKIKERTGGTVQIVATIPGHTAGSTSQVLADLTKTIAARLQITALPFLLSRTKTIEKLAHGGDRSVQVHYDSMVVTNHLDIAGKSILLIDDVRTTGNSMEAAANLLLKGGAKVVHLIAIGQTSA